MSDLKLRLVGSSLAWILLLGACQTGRESEPLARFESFGTQYSLSTMPNSQGPETPCVTLTADLEDAKRLFAICATDDAEAKELASAVDFDDVRSFVIGYGLEPGETLLVPRALTVLTPEDEERRYFVVRYPAGPIDGSLTVERADGTTREIHLTSMK